MHQEIKLNFEINETEKDKKKLEQIIVFHKYID